VIKNCYAQGYVLGYTYEWPDGRVLWGRFIDDYSQYLGGLVGLNTNTICYCYSTADLEGPNRIGGLVGDRILLTYQPPTIDTDQCCFWDITTSHQTESKEGAGLATDQLQNRETYLNAGWDFVDETDNGTDDIWKMPEEKGYPILYYQRR
jgi:hypothetical protein